MPLSFFPLSSLANAFEAFEKNESSRPALLDSGGKEPHLKNLTLWGYLLLFLNALFSENIIQLALTLEIMGISYFYAICDAEEKKKSFRMMHCFFSYFLWMGILLGGHFFESLPSFIELRGLFSTGDSFFYGDIIYLLLLLSFLFKFRPLLVGQDIVNTDFHYRDLGLKFLNILVFFLTPMVFYFFFSKKLGIKAPQLYMGVFISFFGLMRAYKYFVQSIGSTIPTKSFLGGLEVLFGGHHL